MPQNATCIIAENEIMIPDQSIRERELVQSAHMIVLGRIWDDSYFSLQVYNLVLCLRVGWANEVIGNPLSGRHF